MRIETIPKLIAIDLDGVLIDTSRISLQVISEVLAKAGYDVGWLSSDISLVGQSTSPILRQIESRSGRTIAKETVDEIYRSTRRLENQPVLFSGAISFLDSLKPSMAIVSNGNRANTLAKLEHVGLLDRFKGAIFTRSDVDSPKPAPDIYLAAAKHFHVTPSSCVAIEDSLIGVNASHQAGYPTLALVHHRDLFEMSSSQLIAAGASNVYSSFESLAEDQSLLIR